MTQHAPQDELLVKMKKVFKRFQAGGDLAPIADRREYESTMQSLPADERTFAEEATQMADMLQYCDQQKIAVPAGITVGMRELRHLPLAERISRIRDLNRAFIAHIFDVSEDSRIRQ